jgi:uncharacterized DUF497 family protein
MRFEWDETKRVENLRLRQVDFLDATGVFDDPLHIEIPDDRKDYGEERTQIVGMVGDDAYFVVCTMRGEVCRIITAWRLGENGKRRYQKLYERRTPGN